MWFTKNPLAVILIAIIFHYFGIFFMDWADQLHWARESYRPNVHGTLQYIGICFRCFWIFAILMTIAEIHIIRDSRRR